VAVPITIFADFTCPACYLTEAALWRRAGEGGVTVTCRAAELEPVAREAGWERELAPLAAALDLPLRPPEIWPRTGKAHEAAKLARDQGFEEPMRSVIYRAFWAEGLDIGRIDVIQRHAAAGGLDPIDVKIALDIDRFRDEVLRDQEVARRLGIRRGPVLYLGTGPGARILTGAQTEESIRTAVTSYRR
jgi:predicted DsbA family dithiol-disulfide isomerase